MTALDTLWVGLRAFGFIAAFQAAGGALFLALFGDRVEGQAPTLRRLVGYSAVAALLLVAARMLLEPARMLGDLAGVWDPMLHGILHGSSAGAASGVLLLGLALIALGAVGRGGTGAAAGVVGATLAAASFALTGHVTGEPVRSLVVPLLVVHLLGVAFWFGALLPLHAVAGRAAAAEAASVIQAFSRLALWLVPVLFVAGLALALALLPELAALTEPYGLLLLAKVAGFAAVLGLAALNKWRLGPAVATGMPAARRAFRRSLEAEWVLIAAVLAITAVMTGFFSP